MVSEMRKNIKSRYDETIEKIHNGTELDLEDYDWLLSFPTETREYYDFIKQCRRGNDILNIINSPQCRITFLRLLQNGYRRFYG